MVLIHFNKSRKGEIISMTTPTFSKMIAILNGPEWKASYPNSTYWFNTLHDQHEVCVSYDGKGTMRLIEKAHNVLVILNSGGYDYKQSFKEFWKKNGKDILFIGHNRYVKCVPQNAEALLAFQEQEVDMKFSARQYQNGGQPGNDPLQISFTLDLPFDVSNDVEYRLEQRWGEWFVSKHLVCESIKNEIMFFSSEVETREQVEAFVLQAKKLSEKEKLVANTFLDWVLEKGCKVQRSIGKVYFKIGDDSYEFSIILSECGEENRFLLRKVPHYWKSTTKFIFDEVEGRVVVPDELKKIVKTLKKEERYKQHLLS